MICDGRTLQAIRHSDLFWIIGTRFGGEGQSFALPDLRGASPLSHGHDPDLPPASLGQRHLDLAPAAASRQVRLHVMYCIGITGSYPILKIDVNGPLYTVLGTHYGGDGQTTFALPDLRGRASAGVDGRTDHGVGATSGLGGDNASLIPSAVSIGGSLTSGLFQAKAEIARMPSSNRIAPKLRGIHREELPLNNQVLAFGSGGR